MSANESFLSEYERVAGALAAWAHLRTRGVLGTVIDAEDLVQEVVLESWQAYERYNPTLGSFRAWMFGVATRVAADALRRQARRQPVGAFEAEPMAEWTTISRRVRRQEALENLIRQLDGLEPTDRELVIYRGLEGLDHKLVGELLGITTEAAAKRWQRLRDQIVQWPAATELLSEH